MDKKQMEKYLKMYPEIDREIERLQSNLEYFITEKERYHNIEISEKERNMMFETIEKARQETTQALREVMEAKRIIQRGLQGMTALQKDIIRHRHWRHRPVKWQDIANELNFHRVYVERQYKNALEILVT